MTCRLHGAKPLSELVNAGMLLIGPYETNFSEILIEIIIHENEFESVIGEMAAILSRPQCVN